MDRRLDVAFAEGSPISSKRPLRKIAQEGNRNAQVTDLTGERSTVSVGEKHKVSVGFRFRYFWLNPENYAVVSKVEGESGFGGNKRTRVCMPTTAKVEIRGSQNPDYECHII